MKKNQVKNKIIVLGDTHGRNKWEQIVKQSFDKVIFLGDYFDSFDIPFQDQWENFMDILEFKKENPDKVILLLGNHDYHYLCDIEEHYSGYHYENKNQIAACLNSELEDNNIQICYSHEDWIFSHAGITTTWAINNNIDFDNLEKSINELFKTDKQAFKFTEGVNYSNYGDDITQSPIWVRPRSLGQDKIDGVKQVVGHTHQEHIQNYDDMFFIDTLEYGNEYLIINNGKPEIGEI